jgi:hypothetical protein
MRRRIPASIALTASALAVAACSSAASPSAGGSATPPAAASSAPAAAAPDATLGPLTLGTFPATTDGKLAKNICTAWAGLRHQYATNVQNDTPYQLNQWFSSSAWSAEMSDAQKLGATDIYASLAGALGVATVGDTASINVAREVDKACTAG